MASETYDMVDDPAGSDEQTYGLSNSIPHPKRFPDSGVPTRVLAIGNGRRVPQSWNGTTAEPAESQEDWDYCRNYSDY